MKYMVIEKYETEFINPIIVKKNENIIIENEKGSYENWFFCRKCDGSNSGWIPGEIIIKIEDNYGIISEDYSAKELNVEKGLIIRKIKEINGWIWCECENTKEIGWVPVKNVKML